MGFGPAFSFAPFAISGGQGHFINDDVQNRSGLKTPFRHMINPVAVAVLDSDLIIAFTLIFKMATFNMNIIKAGYAHPAGVRNDVNGTSYLLKSQYLPVIQDVFLFKYL